MVRILFKLLAVLSLLACVTIGALWARSYARSDKLVWTRDDGQRLVRSAPGHVVLSLYLANGWGRNHAAGRPGLTYERGEPVPAAMELMTVMLLCSDATARTVYWERGGFGWSQRRSSRDLIVTGVAPFWSVTLATAAPPLGWWARRLVSLAYRRRRHKRLGLCPTCGYDLRAT